MPRSLLVRVIRPLGQWCLRQSWFASPLKRVLRRFPVLFVRLRQWVLHAPLDPVADRILAFETFDLVFAGGPLQDQRGIGRVAWALFNTLAQAAEERLKSHPSLFAQQRVRPKIHLYAAIQWCPPSLPPGSVVLIHDVTPLVLPSDFPAASVEEWQNRLRPIAHQASVVASISQSSARDIEAHLGLEVGSVAVVYNGITPLPQGQCKPALASRLPDGPYLVFIGTHDHHKNLDVLLHALADPRLAWLHLVWVGDAHSLTAEPVPAALRPRVHLLGRLPDDQLSGVLSRAWLLAFPSLYEGFGLPPFEAALLGVPSICSARPAMTELLSESAWFVPAEDPLAWAEQLLFIHNNPAAREAMAQRARARAQEFQWRQVVDGLLRLAEAQARAISEQPVKLQSQA